MSTRLSACEQVPVAELGTRLATLRLRAPDAVSEMARSLERHGQLAAIIVHRTDDGLEVIDGFKRVFAARAIGFAELRAETWLVDAAAAKAAMSALNETRGLDELEHAWVVRSLYREDGLSQPAIGVLLGRDKSWVCRRLALAESLSPDLEVELRLGLFSTSIARELVRLPRGNQSAALQVILDRGLTVRQVARVVQELHATPERIPERLAELARGKGDGHRRGTKTPRTAAELVLSDAHAVSRLGARLQARLHEAPLVALDDGVREVVTTALGELRPVLAALLRTLERITEKESYGTLDHA